MKKLTVSIIILTVSSLVSAHGENQLGPNKGYLKMPGGFHTEVVPQDDGSLKIFLTDIEFKNPKVKDSSVQVSVKNKKKKTDLDCRPMRDHFRCSSKGVSLKSGTLTVLAVRDAAKGAEAVYTLPLKLESLPHH